MSKLSLIYVRVSTTDQSPESQHRALSDYCAKNNIQNYEFFTDHGISGAKESRPALNRMMEKVEQGLADQVLVFSFSRFARSVTHLLRALEIFKRKEVRFLSITEALDTNSPMGMALFTILGALAQLERELIRERVCAGLRNARAKGKRIGRARMRNSALIEQLLDAGMSFRSIAKIARCSHGSVSAQKKEWLLRKSEEEKQKLDQISASMRGSQVDVVVSEMKSLKMSDDLVSKVQNKLESDARDSVRGIQGNSYETFD